MNKIALTLLLANTSNLAQGIKIKSMSQVESQFWPFDWGDEEVASEAELRAKYMDECMNDEACKLRVSDFIAGLKHRDQPIIA